MARPVPLLVVLAVLLLPGAASAAQPMLGLTDDGRVLRFDAARPGTIDRTVGLVGLRDGDTARAIAAGENGLPWVLGAQGRFYRLDQWTGQLMKPIETQEFWNPMSPAPPSDQPLLLAMPMWSTTGADVALANFDMWRTDTISAHTQDDGFWKPSTAPPPPAPQPELGAIAAPVGSLNSPRLFGIDVVNDTLLSERSYESEAKPLGVDARAPAGLAALSAEQALLASTAAAVDRSEIHLVNLATGAATPVGVTPAGVRLVSVMRIDPPTFTFESPTHFFTPSVHESVPENTSVRIVRNGDPAVATSVSVRLGGDGPYGNLGPAQPGDDYDAAPQTVAFAPGQRHADVPLTFFDDDVPEAMEDVGVQLEPGPGARASSVRYGFSIHDDDTQVVEREYAIWESEGGLTLPIIRPPAGYLGLSVPQQVTDGTAVRGDDYTVPGTDVVFKPNQGRGELPVALTDDTTAEGDETVVITFGASPRHRVTGVARTVRVTIRDNDRAVAVRRSSLSAPRRHRLGRALRVRVVCAQACSGTLDLMTDSKRAKRARTKPRLARRALKHSRTKTRTVTIRLPKPTTRRLRHVAPVRASLKLRLRLGTAPAATLRRTVTLVR